MNVKIEHQALQRERCTIPLLMKKHDEEHSYCINGFALGIKPQKQCEM